MKKLLILSFIFSIFLVIFGSSDAISSLKISSLEQYQTGLDSENPNLKKSQPISQYGLYLNSNLDYFDTDLDLIVYNNVLCLSVDGSIDLPSSDFSINITNDYTVFDTFNIAYSDGDVWQPIEQISFTDLSIDCWYNSDNSEYNLIVGGDYSMCVNHGSLKMFFTNHDSNETILPSVLDETNDYFTNSDELLLRKEFTINDYPNSLYGTASTFSIAQADLYDVMLDLEVYEDDPIVEIVPKRFFKESGEQFSIGRDYGFYINTFPIGNGNFQSTVLIFDITTITDLVETIDCVIIEVKLLFQYEYLYINPDTNFVSVEGRIRDFSIGYSIQSNFGFVIPVPIVQTIGDFNHGYDFVIRYGEVNDYYLKDISFAGTLYNEQEVNLINGSLYDPNKDNGSFFTSWDYIYNPSSDPNKDMLILSNISYFMGFVPNTGFLSQALSTIVFFNDNISISEDVSNNENFSNWTNIGNERISTQLLYETRKDQINEYGNLTKTAGIVVNTGNNATGYGKNDPVTMYFRISSSTPVGEEHNYTRFVSNIGLKIVKRNDRSVKTMISSQDYFLRDIVYKDINVEMSTASYILPNGKNYFKFTPTYSAYYNFIVSGNDDAVVNLSTVEGQTTSDYGKKVSAYLETGETYYLETSLNNEEYGIFNLTVTLDTFSSNSSKTLTIRLSGTILKLQIDKNGGYKIGTNKPSIRFVLLDEWFQEVTASISPSLDVYLEKTKTYYLNIYNSNSGYVNCTTSFYEIAHLVEGDEVEVTSNNKLILFTFKAPLNVPDDVVYSIAFYGYLGALEPRFYGIADGTTMSTEGCYIINFELAANQEICFGGSAGGAFKVKLTKVVENYKWVVNNVESPTNTITLNRGTTTRIRLKINGFYFDGWINTFVGNGYSFNNGYLTISNDCIASDSAERDPYIHIYAIKNDSPYVLNIFVGHSLNISFSEYNDDISYGFSWKTFSNVEQDRITIYYRITLPNGESEVFEDLTGLRVGSLTSIQYKVETKLGYRGLEAVEVLIEKIVLKQEGRDTTIYNTQSQDFIWLTDIKQKQNFTMYPMMINPCFAGGTGVEGDPYLISCYRHLDNIRSAEDALNDIAFSFKLTKDIINAEGIRWQPICNFFGTLDGNHKKITGLKIFMQAESLKTIFGLFKFNHGIIKNLTVYDAQVDHPLVFGVLENIDAFLGIFAGVNYGIIDNCNIDMSNNTLFSLHSPNSYVGGITAVNFGEINNCIVKIFIIYGYGDKGGIAAVNFGKISDCDFYGSIRYFLIFHNYLDYDYPWQYSMGGITGINYAGTITGCTNFGELLYTEQSSDSFVLQPKMGHITGTDANGHYSGNYMCLQTAKVVGGNLKLCIHQVKVFGVVVSTTYHDQRLYVRSESVGKYDNEYSLVGVIAVYYNERL